MYNYAEPEEWKTGKIRGFEDSEFQFHLSCQLRADA